MSQSNIGLHPTLPIEDPSIAIKKELTEEGEAIVSELGKAIRSLIKHSNVHDNLMTISKTFSAHELNVTQTDDMIHQMSSLSKELSSQINLLRGSFQALDGINNSVTEINQNALSFTKKTPMSSAVAIVVIVDKKSKFGYHLISSDGHGLGGSLELQKR
ncbi:hypothetical protein DFA_00850 [Cavenderia fasciculata]|uniref:BLOC-1-related complex subunit 7 n=1 Tax=Cavenderia fasciculata TaxID=261658 RepID=F4PU55_CACFS|nr:uncharacterized protein DFA_00850 [Cavenderia fasciculata]EGG20981.1 hypothetical protein DFA_00850 [Cavenderia fasciculata]|eukprot:XP_004358831.1 hypothetical protein DFA_00850 [Cavenderia fasciculata]